MACSNQKNLTTNLGKYTEIMKSALVLNVECTSNWLIRVSNILICHITNKLGLYVDKEPLEERWLNAKWRIELPISLRSLWPMTISQHYNPCGSLGIAGKSGSLVSEANLP